MKKWFWVVFIIALLHVAVCIGYWSFAHHFLWLIFLSNAVFIGSCIAAAVLLSPGLTPDSVTGRPTTFDRLNLWWMVIAIIVTSIGWQCRMLQWPWASEVLLVAFAAWLLLILAQLVMRFGYEVVVPTRMMVLVIVFFGITCSIALVDEKQAVLWRYRNHPDFIQVYEWHCLDPENEELRLQLILEHQRIVLSEEEFRTYQKTHRLEQRGKNQW